MKIDKSYLTINSSSGGYVLLYKGRPIGGAGNVENDRPGPHRLPDAQEYNRQARGELCKLGDGKGRPKFVLAIRQIESEIATQWPDAPKEGDYLGLGGERHTTVDRVCGYGSESYSICDIHGVMYTVTRDPENDNQTRRAFKLAYPQAVN